MIERVTLEALLAGGDVLDAETMRIAESIVGEVRSEGVTALRRFALEFGDLADPEQALWLDRSVLEAAFHRLPESQRGVLQRTAARIESFARGQRNALGDYSVTESGFELGHTCAPVQCAGCYAPGGRYPLPSSVLMTAVTARAAGVETVVVASPRPGDVTLGAAFLARVDGFLPVGGAQAVAALAYGVGDTPACDVVVGPGNRFVTAAKYVVSRDVGIDMLAGPSELVVVADGQADPVWIAADLLAQAEHDEDARPILLAVGETIAAAVEREVATQLASLPTRAVAELALRNGGIVICDLDSAVQACDALAPEHLALHLSDPDEFRDRVSHYGAVFVGGQAAEVLGDYGIGPNHVLPTGGAARHTGGLSVFDFLRVRTHVREIGVADPSLLNDVHALAEMEGLAGHARSAKIRGE